MADNVTQLKVNRKENARGCSVLGDVGDVRPVTPCKCNTRYGTNFDEVPQSHTDTIPKQYHNPMMVGYEPPR